MGRPKLATPRNHQLNISLTDSEQETVLRNAAASGIRPVDWARATLFGSRRAFTAAAKAAATHLDPLLLNALSRIGSNLNQIAKQLNSLRMPTPPDLAPLLTELREVLRRNRLLP